MSHEWTPIEWADSGSQTYDSCEAWTTTKIKHGYCEEDIELRGTGCSKADAVADLRARMDEFLAQSIARTEALRAMIEEIDDSPEMRGQRKMHAIVPEAEKLRAEARSLVVHGDLIDVAEKLLFLKQERAHKLRLAEAIEHNSRLATLSEEEIRDLRATEPHYENRYVSRPVPEPQTNFSKDEIADTARALYALKNMLRNLH